MGSFGILEIIFLLILGILVFGGELPEVGRKLGRIWGKIQRYISLLQQDIEQETNTIQDQIDLEEATNEPYVSRQESPETKTPEDYKSSETEPSDTFETEPYEFEDEEVEAEEKGYEDDDDVRTFRDAMDENEQNEPDSEATDSVDEDEKQ